MSEEDYYLAVSAEFLVCVSDLILNRMVYLNVEIEYFGRFRTKF